MVRTKHHEVQHRQMAEGLRDRARQFIDDHDLAFPTGVFMLHTLFVMLFAALASRYAASTRVVEAVGYRVPPRDGWRELVIGPLSNWDGYWYALIAERGYDYHPATTAYWPLFPGTMRLVSWLLQITPEAAGIILANLAFFAALVVLQRLVRREWNQEVARRTLWLLAFFPTAFYFSAAYTESFFLLFASLTFYYARGDRWWLAAVTGFAAALTRNVGVLLVIPLAVMFIKQHRLQRDTIRLATGRAPAVMAPALGPLVYFGMLWVIYRDPLLALKVQQEWARTQAMPWETLRMAFEQSDFSWLRMIIESPSWTTLTSTEVRLTFADFESLDIITTLLVIPLLGFVLLRLPVEYSLFTAIVFLLPLFSPSTIHPLMSIPRFVLVLFPLFIALAILTRPKPVFLTCLAISVTLEALLIIQFSTWFWVA